MPIYEYHCNACQKDHEVIQKVSDSPLIHCPSCAGPIEKKLSLSSFQLKGGGWYKEGYSSVSKDKKGEDGAPKPVEGTSKTETPTKTESKGAEKSKVEKK